MNILGIETSCDETAASVVRDGREILSNVVASQIDLHATYGGVIPELAARSHLEVINPVVSQALTQSKLAWEDIDAIAVVSGPGLIGSLLIGTLAARTLSIIKNKPLYNVHHVLAHFYANFSREKSPEFPALCLVISGGHTQLMYFESPGKYQIVGQTQDDAVGEAFDKVAKIIGLPYPGGPNVSKLAESGDAERFTFTKPRLTNPYDFSFSGVKTALLRTAQKLVGQDHSFPSHQIAELLPAKDQADLAASFQKVVTEILLEKTTAAVQEFQPKSICLAGGVAANRQIREAFANRFAENFYCPDLKLCTDNAAMVAIAGFYISQYQAAVDPYELEVHPQHGWF